MDEQRLIDLEIKYSHQVIALEELQQVVLEHQRTIEALMKTVKLLTDSLDSANGLKVGPGDEKPPHY